MPTARQRKYLELELRIRLNAIKFCPTYRSWWKSICTKHGGAQGAEAALKALRAGTVASRRPVHDALDKLAQLPLLMGRGPVLPRSLADYPEQPWPTARQPELSLLLGVWNMLPLREREIWTFTPFTRPVLITLDLGRSNVELAQGIAALRREIDHCDQQEQARGGEHPRVATPRTNRSRKYRWDGPDGWEVTFSLVNAAIESGATLRDLADKIAYELWVSKPSGGASRAPLTEAQRARLAAFESKNASRRIGRAMEVIDAIESRLQRWNLETAQWAADDGDEDVTLGLAGRAPRKHRKTLRRLRGLR